MPDLGSHDSFEQPTQHVRSYAPLSVSLGDGEVKPLEQPIERLAPEIVGNVAGEPTLQGMRLEQPTVEKGDGTKCRRGAAAFVGRAVERAEEERSQQISMYPAPSPEAAIHLFHHEAVPPAEPAFRLD